MLLQLLIAGLLFPLLLLLLLLPLCLVCLDQLPGCATAS